MVDKHYDLAVIGAGPGGEAAAIHAAGFGLKVALIEKSDRLGGTCLNVGCIPSKVLIHAASDWQRLKELKEQGFEYGEPKFNWSKIIERKNQIVKTQESGLRYLMKKNKVDILSGFGYLESATSVQVKDKSGAAKSVTTSNILLATGSRVREIKNLPIDHQQILSSDDILSIPAVPTSLLIVGGGVIGMEFACLFARMGSAVSVVEMAPRILPSEDDEVVREFERQLKKLGIHLHTSTTIKNLKQQEGICEVLLSDKTTLVAEKVLVAVGRVPVTREMGLENLGIIPDLRGFIPVDEHYQTSTPGVFAIGDIINTPALAHTATAEALHVVGHITKQNPPVINYAANPNAIYSSPEIASIGFPEEQLKAEKRPYLAYKFPFSPLAKAKIENETVGFIKIIYEPKYREILGVHIIGARATELISEFALGMVSESTVDEIAYTIHPHPTIAETIMEAAWGALGHPLHI